MAIRQPQFVRLARVRRSLGFADPTAGVGYAYVTSQMGTRLTGDPRDVALREALYPLLPGFARVRCASHEHDRFVPEEVLPGSIAENVPVIRTDGEEREQ